jgi:hypothetical protein
MWVVLEEWMGVSCFDVQEPSKCFGTFVVTGKHASKRRELRDGLASGSLSVRTK